MNRVISSAVATTDPSADSLTMNGADSKRIARCPRPVGVELQVAVRQRAGAAACEITADAEVMPSGRSTRCSTASATVWPVTASITRPSVQ